MKHLKRFLCVGFVMAALCRVAATETNINVGVSADDHTGDTLRNAFIKANGNFTELYNFYLNVASNSFQSASANLTKLGMNNGSSITNVELTALQPGGATNGQALTYNSTNNTWGPGTPISSGGGGTDANAAHLPSTNTQTFAGPVVIPNTNSSFAGDGSLLTGVTAAGVLADFNIGDVPVTAAGGVVDFTAFTVGLHANQFQGAFSGSGAAVTGIPATGLASGGTLPAESAQNLTAIPGQNIVGTVASAALSGASITNPVIIITNTSYAVLVNGGTNVNYTAGTNNFGTNSNVGNGGGLTNLNVMNLTGVVQTAQLTAALQGLNASNGAILTNLHATNITGTVSLSNGGTGVPLTDMAAGLKYQGGTGAFAGSSVVPISLTNGVIYIANYTNGDDFFIYDVTATTNYPAAPAIGYNTIEVPVTGTYYYWGGDSQPPGTPADFNLSVSNNIDIPATLSPLGLAPSTPLDPVYGGTGVASIANFAPEIAPFLNFAVTPLGESTVGALELAQPVAPFATPFKTPAMGWMSWNDYGSSGATEAHVLAAANGFISAGLLKLGYNMIEIDAGWMGYRDTSGVIHESAQRFPDGMAATIGKLHALGFKVGLWSGITPGWTNNGTPLDTNNAIWPANFPYGGSTTIINATNLQYLTNDAATFVSWGIDYMKLEAGTNGFTVGTNEQFWVTSFFNTAQNLGHTFYLMGAIGAGLSPPLGVGWQPWMYGIYQAPRFGGFDLSSGQGTDLQWTNFIGNFFWTLPLETNRSPGSFISLDAIPNNQALAESYGCQIVMAMMGAELIYGDVPAGGGLPAMENPNLIAIDQDPANNPCVVIATNSAVLTLMRPLGTFPNQTLAFAFVNTNGTGSAISSATLNFSNYFTTTNLMVLDAVSNLNLTSNVSLTVTVPAATAFCFLVSPEPNAGSSLVVQNLTVNGALTSNLNANGHQIQGAVFTNTVFAAPPLMQIQTNQAASYDAGTDYAVDMTQATTFIRMATIGQNMTFQYCTNFNTATNYQQVMFQIKGDGTHTLSFAVPSGVNKTLIGPYTTNGVVMGSSNGWWTMCVGYFNMPGVGTNITYALTQPNN